MPAYKMSIYGLNEVNFTVSQYGWKVEVIDKFGGNLIHEILKKLSSASEINTQSQAGRIKLEEKMTWNHYDK